MNWGRILVLGLILVGMIGGGSAQLRDFDGFEDGDFTNDPSWTAGKFLDSGQLTVQQSVVAEGNKALEINGNNQDITFERTGDQAEISQGDIYKYYFRTNKSASFRYWALTSDGNPLSTGGDKGVELRHISKDIEITTEDAAGNQVQTVNFGSYQINKWYEFEVEFRPKDNKIDVRQYDLSGNLLDSITVDSAGSTSLGGMTLADYSGYSFWDEVSFTGKPPNKPPSFGFTSVSPDPPLIGETADFSYTASDPDGSIQSVDLVLKDDGSTVFTGSKSSSSGTFSPSVDLTEGDIKATFTATDNNGATTTKTLTRTLTDTKPVVNISQPSGTVFDYGQTINVDTQIDGDSNPNEELSCVLDLDNSQIDQRTVNEGDSYTVNTRSDLGSHNVDVTCTETDDQQSDTGSTSFTVENFKFQSLSGASSGKETTQQSFNAGFKAGDMVNNVSFDLVYDSQIRDQSTVNVSGVTDSSQGFSHFLNLAQTDGVNRDYNVSAEVNYDNLNSGTSKDNVDSSTNTQTVNQAFSYKDSVFEDGLTQLEASTLDFEAQVNKDVNNDRADLSASSTLQQTGRTRTLEQNGLNFTGIFDTDLINSTSTTTDLDTTVTLSFNGQTRTLTNTDKLTLEKIQLSKSSSTGPKTHTTLDNETTNINLYLLEQTKGQTVRLELTNSDLQGLSNHLIRVERAFPDQNETRTVQLAKTGTEGFASTFLQLQERYIFTVFDENGELVDQVGPETVTTTDKRIQVNDGIDPSLANVLNEVQFTDIQRQNQSLSVSYVSETQRLNNLFLKISSDGLFETKTLDVDSSEQPQGQLKVTQFNATDQRVFFELIGTFGETNLTLESGTFGQESNDFGNAGIFVSFLMFTALTLSGLFRPSAAIGLGVISIFVMSFTGFLAVGQQALISIAALAAVLIWRMSSQ